ncbi:MAG TPA: GDP-mannose 4,6-dehydratase [Elusimicrobiota bacterium]|nr:GDP-mannose 4,6-dehydratase [Elusimicrobiota bacterium]
MTKTALITGVNGQDGAYLAQLLLEKGYQVFGAIRSPAEMKLDNLETLGVMNDVKIIPFELLDYANIFRVVEKVNPDEVYNLAAMSFIAMSFEEPFLTSEVTGMGPLRLLEAIRTVNPKIRFFQASSSSMFDQTQKPPQIESTSFHPKNPYAVAKLFAHWTTVNYRETYGMFACSGILFNHESPLRGLEFVTRKITHAAARIKKGLQQDLRIGNLDVQRDWGYAKEYVDAMWRMLQQPQPEDFVIGTGETHSVREFVEAAFKAVDITITWSGNGEGKIGKNAKTGDALITIDPQFFRPTEVDNLVADYSKARRLLGWSPKTQFNDLVKLMVDHDLKKLPE